MCPAIPLFWLLPQETERVTSTWVSFKRRDTGGTGMSPEALCGAQQDLGTLEPR